MKTRSKAILAMAGIALVVLGWVWPREGPAYGMTVGFLRYGTYAVYQSSQVCGYFGLTNIGNQTIVCRGIGASSEQQLTEVLTVNGWQPSEHPWLSPLSAKFGLRPGEVREVPVLVGTNLPWRIGFRFRPRLSRESFWSVLPYPLYKFLFPGDLPDFQEVWTDPVPAPGNLWPQP